MKSLKLWIKKHPQLALSFVQVTLSQVALWEFMPPKVAAGVSCAAGLVQAWLALFYSTKDKQAKEGE